MARPDFKPNSFGTFLDTVRKSSVESAEPVSSSRIRLLQAFGDRKEMNVVELQALSPLAPGDFALALSDLKSRGMISVAGTVAELTEKGETLLAMLR